MSNQHAWQTVKLPAHLRCHQKRGPLTVWVVAVTLLVGVTGCKSTAPKNDDKHPAAPAGSGKTYSIAAKLTSYDGEFTWSHSHRWGHDLGKAPLARFRMIEPPKYQGRIFAILFKYGGSTSPTGLKTSVGKVYTMKLPAEFLEGTAKILDNTSVKNLVPRHP